MLFAERCSAMGRSCRQLAASGGAPGTPGFFAVSVTSPGADIVRAQMLLDQSFAAKKGGSGVAIFFFF